MGKHLKMILAFCCAFALCTTLAACSGSGSGSSSSSSSAASSSASSSDKNYNDRFAGTYILQSNDSDYGANDKELKTLDEGAKPYIVLKESGTYRYYYDDETLKGSYNADSRKGGTIEWDDLDGTLALDGDELTITLGDGSEMVFVTDDAGVAGTGATAVAPSSGSSPTGGGTTTNSAIDPYVGTWILTSMEGSGAISESDMKSYNEAGLFIFLSIERNGNVQLIMTDENDSSRSETSSGSISSNGSSITIDGESLSVSLSNNNTVLKLSDGSSTMVFKRFDGTSSTSGGGSGGGSSTATSSSVYVGDWSVLSIETGDPESTVTEQQMKEFNEAGLVVLIWVDEDGTFSTVMVDMDDIDNPDISTGTIDLKTGKINMDGEILQASVSGSIMTITDSVGGVMKCQRIE